jgi:hypothetical protein
MLTYPAFFPDNDVNKLRSIRIRKAMEYGARFVHPWQNGEGVTHVIVDTEMHYEDVLKHVGLEAIPDDIIIVNQRYPADCISNRILVDPNQKLYEVVWRKRSSNRPRANSGKLRQAPPEECLIVEETPVRRQAEADSRKQDYTEAAETSAQKETRAETGMSSPLFSRTAFWRTSSQEI